MELDIRHWRDIDAAYLNRVLARNEIDGDIAQVEKQLVGTGQLGDCVRFSLEHRSAPPNAPKTLIGKFPSENETSRKAGKFYSIYLREIMFYQKLQPRARITTPDCFFADIDHDTHDFVLLMSDAAPAVQGDQLKGITLAEAKLIIKEAAKLHSAFWQDRTLDEYSWITNTRNADSGFDPSGLAERWAGFQERFGNKVSARTKHLGDALCRNIGKYGEARSQQQTLIHIDYRPDNMLFGTNEGGKPLTVVDWQSISFGPAATDIGNCIAGALAPELRRQHEGELLELYAQELNRLGAGPYDPELLTRHYVLGAYQHQITGISSSMFVKQTERGDTMFLKMVNGAVELIFDHAAQDWFA